MFVILLLFLVLWLLEPFVTYYLNTKKLRRFPNAATFSGVTNLAFILQRLRGFRSKEIHSAHEKHPVVRVGPNVVSFSSPNAIRAIYGHSSPCLKGGSYENAGVDHPGLIEVIDKQKHADKRRILSNAFATRNLEQWEFKVADKVKRMIRQFDQMCCEAREPTNQPGVIDFRRWANLFSVDAIVDIALSERLGCLDQGDDQVTITALDGAPKDVHFIQSLHSARRPTSILVWSAWFQPIKLILKHLPGLFRAQWQAGDGFTAIIKSLVDRRIQRYKNGEELDDLASCLLADKAGHARDLSVAEIEGDVTTLRKFSLNEHLPTVCLPSLVDAGSETTAIALTHVIYFLLKEPAALFRLRQELDEKAIHDDDGVVTYESIKNLPYLRACLDESLRLLPPVSTGLHRVTPSEGYMVDGHHIAGNTIVVVPIYTAHRNPSLFPEPENFQPERWLNEENKGAQASFIPFSTGARGCIGRNITYIEQSILIATLVGRYEFHLPHPQWQLSHEEAFNLWPGPMPLYVQRRKLK